MADLRARGLAALGLLACSGGAAGGDGKGGRFRFDGAPGTDGAGARGPDAGGPDGPAPDGGADAGADDHVELRVLALSDWHGQLDPLTSGDEEVGGAAVLAAYFAADRAAHPHTLTLTAGDVFGASPPLASFFAEAPAVLALDAMGLDATTFGNHDFDRGLGHVQEMIDLARFTFTSCNLVGIGDALEGVARPYHLVEIGGLTVAIIGVTNPDAPERTFPGRMGGLTVADPVQAAMAARRAAADAGAEVFVALAHLGATSLDEVTGAPRGPLIDFARGVEGFHLILGGHTDVEVDTVVDGVPVVENRGRGQSYARVRLTLERGTGRARSHRVEIVRPLAAAVTPDPAVEAVLAPYRADLAEVMDTRLGEAADTFPRGGGLERLGEAALGNLVAEALRDRFDTQLALVHGGGLRAPLPSGHLPADRALRRPAAGYAAGPPWDLVLGDAYAVLPSSHLVVTREVTGAQLWALLEHAVGALPASAGRFAQIAGFRFGHDPAAAPGARVVWVALAGGGAIAADAARYTIALPDFLAAGGDGYDDLLADGAGRRHETLLAEVLADHLRDRGVVAPALDGRIAAVARGVALSEVFYDRDVGGSAGDTGYEWIELYNGGAGEVDLAGWTIRSGGASYSPGQALALTLAPGGCAVVGGPYSDATNHAPGYAMELDFAPDLQNGGGEADAVALFSPDGTIADAVLYGGDPSGIADETGAPGTVDVGDAPAGRSLAARAARTGARVWEIAEAPTPGDCSPLR